MARTLLKHGAHLEAATPGEVQRIVGDLLSARQSFETRVRAAQTVKCDSTGAGRDDVYTVPVGFEFEVRRVFLQSDQRTVSNQPLALNTVGLIVEYLRSGRRIEYANTTQFGGYQIPGTQTWSREQGPYLINGEVFQVNVVGLSNGEVLNVDIEGILRKIQPRN